MELLIVFIIGLSSGMFLEIKLDDFKDQRMEFLEEAAGIEQDGFYLMKDPYNQIWLVEPNRCVQVQ